MESFFCITALVVVINKHHWPNLNYIWKISSCFFFLCRLFALSNRALQNPVRYSMFLATLSNYFFTHTKNVPGNVLIRNALKLTTVIPAYFLTSGVISKRAEELNDAATYFLHSY